MRMLLLLFVSLFTARIMLEALGAEDYGLNNVIAGVIVLFSFFNNTLATASSRFLTFELGTGNLPKLKKTFSSACVTHGSLALFILIMGETLGLCIVNGVLNIPENRVFACNVAFQLTLGQVLITLLQTPFGAIVMSYERMDFYAYLGVFDAIAKLLVCYVVKIVEFDKLITLSVLQTMVGIIVFLIYVVYCRRNFKPTCCFSLDWSRDIVKSMTKFIGWSLVGSVSVVLKNQGVNILINIFFGPVVNAANAIAYRVDSALLGFSSSLTTAINPQITKNYASGQLEKMKNLVFKGGKASFFIMMFFGFPIILDADYILRLWLGDGVPQYASTMTILVIVLSMIESFTYSIGNAVQATGKIRNYQLVVSGLILLNFPFTYILFEMNYPPYMALVVSICLSSIALTVRLYFVKHLLQIKIWEYVRCVFLRTLPVACICLFVSLLLLDLTKESLAQLVLNTLFISFVNILGIWCLGLDGIERAFVKQMGANFFKRFCT